ncbi:MAG: hypothetical protein EPN97_16140 [Alphaproteobacteria bacterium]|nr:MAG: hypothetical protein EPN97_16140 [Alphaproteobacteria bacterium]
MRFSARTLADADLKEIADKLAGIDPAKSSFIATEYKKAAQALATGEALGTPELKEPLAATLWAAVLATLALKTGMVDRTKLWQQITGHPVVQEERKESAYELYRSFRKIGFKDYKVTLKAPPSGYPAVAYYCEFSKKYVNLDPVWMLLLGVEKARSAMMHEVAHALGSLAFPPEIQAVEKEMETIKAKHSGVTDEDRIRYALLDIEWKHRFMTFDEAENSYANRFVISRGASGSEDYSLSLNHVEAVFFGVMAGAGQVADVKNTKPSPRDLFINVKRAIRESLFKNNGFFPDTPEGWRTLGVEPDWIKEVNGTKGWKALQDLTGLCRQMEELQPRPAEMLLGEDHFIAKNKEFWQKRCQVGEEIYQHFIKPLVEELQKEAEKKLRKELEEEKKREKEEQQDQKPQDSESKKGDQQKNKPEKGEKQEGNQQEQPQQEEPQESSCSDGTCENPGGKGKKKDGQKQEKPKGKKSSKGKGSEEDANPQEKSSEGAGQQEKKPKETEGEKKEGDTPAAPQPGPAQEKDRKGPTGEKSGKDPTSDMKLPPKTPQEMKTPSEEQDPDAPGEAPTVSELVDSRNEQPDQKEGLGKPFNKAGKPQQGGKGVPDGMNGADAQPPQPKDLQPVDLNEYERLVAPHLDTIAVLRKDIRKMHERQTMHTKTTSPERSLVPVDGNIARLDAAKLQRGITNLASGKTPRLSDFKNYKLDARKEKSVPDIDIEIIIDISGSLTGAPFEQALLGACCLFEAARKVKGVNLSITAMGMPTPTPIARPGRSAEQISTNILQIRQVMGRGQDFLSPALCDMLTRYVTSRNSTAEKTGMSHAIVLSDGYFNDGPFAQAATKIMHELCSQLTIDFLLIDQGREAPPIVSTVSNCAGEGRKRISCRTINVNDGIHNALIDMVDARLKSLKPAEAVTRGAKKTQFEKALKEFQRRVSP